MFNQAAVTHQIIELLALHNGPLKLRESSMILWRAFSWIVSGSWSLINKKSVACVWYCTAKSFFSRAHKCQMYASGVEISKAVRLPLKLLHPKLFCTIEKREATFGKVTVWNGHVSGFRLSNWASKVLKESLVSCTVKTLHKSSNLALSMRLFYLCKEIGTILSKQSLCIFNIWSDTGRPECCDDSLFLCE